MAFTHHFWLINFSSLLVNALVNIVTIMLTEYGYFVNDDLDQKDADSTYEIPEEPK